MRLLRLDLEKYGAFEGRSLAFRPDAKVHVVYGPNEAGKSSALSAVGDLLFGFAARTDFAFRHATTELRLGAEIASSRGEALSFRRRKGNKATLIGADEQPLRDDLLAPFVGQLTRETFERAFGLASDSLRQGAEDLLSSEGDGAASLFAAASGLRGVETLRRAFDAEADGLFSPQASKRPFNVLSNRLKDAQKALRDNELGATQWKRLNDEIGALEERHRALEAERSRFRTERARLERLSRAHGAALDLSQARRALDEFGDAPELSAETVRTLGARLDHAEDADKVRARAADALRLAEEDLARVRLDEAALAAAGEIEALVRDSGAFAKSGTDLPRVRREAEEIDEGLARLARRLGLEADVSIETMLPTDAARSELAGLLLQGREIAHARDVAARQRGVERARLDALAAQRGADRVQDPKPLREAFSALGPQLRSVDRRAELTEEHARDVDALTGAAARLSPPVDDLERLASLPTPSAEWIARMRRDHDRIGLDRARVDELAAARSTEDRKISAELTRLGAVGPIASPETIRAARDARDGLWARLRLALSTDARSGARAVDVADYEAAVAEADRLADRVAEDARRAVRLAELERRRVELGVEREDVTAERAAVDARAAAFAEDWASAWREFGVSPGAPDEMEGWRKELSGLFEKRETVDRRGAALARLDAVERDLRPALEALASAVGIDVADRPDTVALGQGVERRLNALADRWQQQSALEAQIGEAERRLGECERDVVEIAAREEGWRAGWIAALPRLGLGPDVSFNAAEAALAAWREAPGLVDQRQTLARRIRGMERDATEFRDRVEKLVSAFAAELADLPPQSAAERLGKRLIAARAAEARFEDACQRRDEAGRGLATAERAAVEAASALDLASAPIAPASELRALLPRIAERSRLYGVAVERRDQLLRLGGAIDEAALLAELDGFDPDAALAEAETARLAEERADREAQQAWAELHAARANRDALGGAGAERAAAEGRAAGAALYEMAREWSVAKLASLLLGAAIDRARTQDRSPTLERAGRLFATLTGGAFSGFAEDYENDAIVLFGRRATGENVHTRGMSEGTRDQFYLALRLAALEDYAARAEPAPFIGDDLFASFDDARTANGLKALAEIGANVQPILFTHHRAVVETARSTLGPAVDVIEIAP